ncbi:MAG: membrane protein YczE [Ferrimicrobium sp.]
MPIDNRFARTRRLLLGLLMYAMGNSLLVLGGLGLDPWNVFAQGLALHTGIPIGTWAVIVGFVVLMLWIPLRQRPGVGTLANVAIIGSTMDLILSVAPTPHGVARWVVMLLGVALTGVATSVYIGAGLGPGPRDGLMVGISARGHSLRAVRTGIELIVLVIGWWLGGTVGIGTLVYAISIGPLVHLLLPLWAIPVSSMDS